MGIEIDHIEDPYTLLNEKKMPIKSISLTVISDMSISWYFLFIFFILTFLKEGHIKHYIIITYVESQKDKKEISANRYISILS